MHSNYSDILSKINEEPQWYDSNGTPRYAPFEPRLCPDIYAHTVVLMQIACQACGTPFKVEVHAGVFDEIRNPKKLHYGDPPRHDVCVGDSMNCDDISVLEVWHRNYSQTGSEWVRYRELEGLIDREET